MVNRYKPHLEVIFEDEPYREIANGVLLSREWFSDETVCQINVHSRPVAGWRKVGGKWIEELETNSCKFVLILIDFDGTDGGARRKILYDSFFEHKQGLTNIQKEALKERIFIIGAKKQSEDLKRSLQCRGCFENLGNSLHEHALTELKKCWENCDEIERMQRVLNSAGLRVNFTQRRI